MSSTNYNAKHLYSFDPEKKSIEYPIASLRNPQFFENLLVEFGTGFNRPGLEETYYDGRGFVMIYDLTRAKGQREVKKHIINGGEGRGWDGSIDKKKQEISAFDRVSGKELKFPFSNLCLLSICSNDEKSSATLPAASKLNPTECKPFSSVAEFRQKYSISVHREMICIMDKETNVPIASLETELEDRLCSDATKLPYLHRGILYFLVGSEQYKNNKYVYSFDPSKMLIEYVVARLQNPHFFENLLVEFGTGFNRPGPQKTFYAHEGVITIYDLTRPAGEREVKKHIIKGCSAGGWDGDIEEKSREITAFDHVTGRTESFSISELLK